MNKRLLIPVFIVAAAMAACGNPTFQSVNLGGLAYYEGDLPAEGMSVEVRTVDDENEWKYPQWTNLQLGNADAETVLDVDVILFSDKKELKKAYEVFTVSGSQKEYTDYDPPEIGYARIGRRQDWGDGSSAINVSYQRCYAMVNIWARFEKGSVLTEEIVYQYADALDKRLNNAVCPI